MLNYQTPIKYFKMTHLLLVHFHDFRGSAGDSAPHYPYFRGSAEGVKTTWDITAWHDHTHTIG